MDSISEGHVYGSEMDWKDWSTGENNQPIARAKDPSNHVFATVNNARLVEYIQIFNRNNLLLILII